VHEDHGIGRYGGLLAMEVVHKVNDFILVEYANNSRLYIPADRVSILQKYAGAGEGNPRLDQLGGYSWNITKQKAKKIGQENRQAACGTLCPEKISKRTRIFSP